MYPERKKTAMRSDLAALTPPLVMAAAFIAGVIALLRREMAPRRRRGMTQSPQSGAPRDPPGEITPPGFTHIRGGGRSGHYDRASGGNSASNDPGGSGSQDLPGRADDGGIRHTEDRPPGPPKV